jgi:hypothetical protein
MEATDTVDKSGADSSESDSLNRIVDWVTAMLCWLAGLFFAAVGAGLYAVADRDTVREFVVEENIQIDQLTQEEVVDLFLALLTWGGLGTILLGVLLIVGGVAFLLYRRRQERRDETHDPITLAIVGGIVSIVVSAVPFSPILGGLVSGYLRKGTTSDGIRVGAYAGVVASLPVVLLGVLVIVVFAAVATELGIGSLAVAGGFAILFALIAGVAFIVALSALGGFLGTKLAYRNGESNGHTGDANEPTDRTDDVNETQNVNEAQNRSDANEHSNDRTDDVNE